MGVIERLLGAGAPTAEKRMTFDEMASVIQGPLAASGRAVTPDSALQQVTLVACVRLISETAGMLPLILYERLEPGKAKATKHPLYPVLHDLPNPELTRQELLETLSGHLCTQGDAYCEIEYDGAGRRRALWPLRPDQMQVGVNEHNALSFIYTLPNGQRVALERWRVWHIRGWGTDPWRGKSPIALAREAIGLALATEEFGSRWFSNGSRPGGFLRRPVGAPKLSDDRLKALREQVQTVYGGLSQAHRIAIMEEGMEWVQMGIPPEDAQFLQTRQYQDTQICTLYRVPPHMVGITDKSTSWGSGIEQQGLGFQTFTMLPYLERFTQSIARDLLSAAERQRYYAEFLTAALARGDLAGRYNAYSIGRNGGWLSVNDIRELENMNPVAGGDVYLKPLNMTALDGSGDPAAGDNTAGEGDDGTTQTGD